jgi:integrase
LKLAAVVAFVLVTGVVAAVTFQQIDLIFASNTGRPLTRDFVDRHSYKPLLKRAGLPEKKLHDLRHTCTTLLLGQGVHPTLVQKLLGHASVVMTLNRYSHWIPSMGDQTARAMEAALR